MRQNINFYAAMYLRLSRDDAAVGCSNMVGGAGSGDSVEKGGFLKAESNSIGSQRELIRAFLREQTDMELYDSYVDDGYSGSNFDRPEFKRLMSDIEAGRVNCVIVKDLSRFGRDYIESGRYLERVFPALGVRFIALTDHYDSLSADFGERMIVLPVKNFINDSYCRDISAKVKSQLAVKRKAGECLSAFAVYGYVKSQEDRRKLAVDDHAAEVVRRIFDWKIEGHSVAAIAGRLNSLGILPPKKYKLSKGLHFNGGFAGGASGWSSVAVKRILTNETYLGHLLQGRTEKVNHKVKRSIEKPAEEWVRVENTHEAIISADDFETVQRLLKTDGRACQEKGAVNPFSGILFCGDCGEQMVRRIVRHKDSVKVYYICSTKNRGDGCSRHSIGEEMLKSLLGTVVRRYANDFLEQVRLFEQVREQEADPEVARNCYSVIACFNGEIQRLKEEQRRYEHLCAGLFEDLRQGVVTKEEFEHLRSEFQRKAERLEQAGKEQEGLIRKILRDGAESTKRLAKFQKSLKLEEIDRHTLTSLVRRVLVYEDRRLEVEFDFQDRRLVMEERNMALYPADGSIGGEGNVCSWQEDQSGSVCREAAGRTDRV